MAVHGYSLSKHDYQKRLRRIEGQVRGIARMIEDERYCIDILHQMQAIKAALSRVEDAVLSDHAKLVVGGADVADLVGTSVPNVEWHTKIGGLISA